MTKVRVLLLSGCNRCHELTTKLSEANIPYQALDADVNDNIASATEKLVGNTRYPMVIAEKALKTTVLFIAEDTSQLGAHSSTSNTNKIGCINVDAIIHNLNLINN